MESMHIVVVSIVVFAISLLIVSQQFLNLYKSNRLEPTEHKYSEYKLDIAFIFMMTSVFMFIKNI